MTLQRVAGNRTGEDSDDLMAWLKGLEGCPTISAAVLARCANEVHGDDRPTWFYVEGDAQSGLARRRCLACGLVVHLLDSESHWTHPPMHCCGTCGQSMFELAVGLHIEDAFVDWLAVGLRCVGCGCLEGLTDMNVDSLTYDEVAARV